MTDDNSNLVDMENFDTFKDSFFNPDKAEPAKTEDVKDENTETDEELKENGEDGPATEENEETDKDEDKESKPKGKKSFQERINEVYAEAKAAERERDALRRELAEIKSRLEDKPKTEEKTVAEQLPPEAPQPDALDKDGNPVYPLGEYDPQFIKDLTKFTIAEERKALKEAEEREAAEAKVKAAQDAISQTWLENVEKAEEELPDLREKIGSLTTAFEGIEPAYGEFLAMTIMASEVGPQIMYYLSQNIGEAQKIVASGPAAATRAIGRLEARFEKPMQEEKRNKAKVSDAPVPPEARTRGAGGQFAVAPDTRDLAAFRREFFKDSK